MSRLALDMTTAAGKAAPHFPKIHRRFWHVECLTRQHEKNCCIHSAASDRGYNDRAV